MKTREITIEEALVLGTGWSPGGGLTVRQPSVSEIVRHDELAYYRTVGLLTCISSDCKATLAGMGFKWDEISDFEMFYMATRGLTPDDTGILLGEELDLSHLYMYVSKDGARKYLGDNDGKVVITEETQQKLSAFLCRMHQITKKPEFPVNDFAREMLLEESREEIERGKKSPQRPVLPTAISYVANAPGSKYGYESCLELPYSMFMDCLARTQIISEATALRTACLSGMIDTSHIDRSDLNMLREIRPPKEHSPLRESSN